MAKAGNKKRYIDKSKFSFNIELDESVIKFECSANNGIRETETDETKNAIGSGQSPFALSAIFPPMKLPTASPSKVTPMTEVQVNTDDPIIGATIREEISSTVITANPARKEPGI